MSKVMVGKPVEIGKLKLRESVDWGVLFAGVPVGKAQELNVPVSRVRDAIKREEKGKSIKVGEYRAVTRTVKEGDVKVVKVYVVRELVESG